MAAKKKNIEPSFVVDIYRNPDTGKYIAAAVQFLGKRRLAAKHWKERSFDTSYEAEHFVRDYYGQLGMREMVDTSMLYYR